MEYLTLFVNQVHSFMGRLRWRAWHILNPSNAVEKETFGFKTQAAPPSNIEELKEFENNLLNLTSKIKFRKKTNSFQSKLRADIRSLNQEPKLIISADKTSNFYKVESGGYKTLLKRNVEKECKKGPDNLIDNFNREDKAVAEDLDIADRMIHQTQKQSAFVTFKDTKDNFYNNPQCRLVNPTKSDLGKIAKQIVEKIVINVKHKTGLNLWKNTYSCIDWYRSIQNKQRYNFIQYDINSFYPNILRKLVTDAIKYARHFTKITQQDEQIIIQSCRSVLVSDEEIWVRKGEDSGFSVTIGSYCGAEIAEMVGCFLLSQVIKSTPLSKEQVGLYRDDGLLITDGTARQGEILKKKLCEIFSQHGLGLEVKANRKCVDFLDVSLDLNQGTFKPYKKPNDTPQYVHSKSDHPPSILKNIPPSVNKRLSSISSSKELFDAAAPSYQQALNEAGYNHNLEYDENACNNNNRSSNKKKRKRNLIFFNPPFSMSVKTNIGKDFLKIIDTSFPPGNPLHGKLNRHNIKLSYCTVQNMKSRVDRHNVKILAADKEEVVEPCNCTQFQCPLNGECGRKNCIYQAKVESSDGATEYYVGATAQTFKERYSGHRSNFMTGNPRNKHGTKLSTYIWKLREEGKTFQIHWRIIDRASPYNPLTKKCNLCNKEKFYIIFKRNMATLNNRNELYSVCRHRVKTLLSKS